MLVNEKTVFQCTSYISCMAMNGRSTARHVQGYAFVRVDLMLCSFFWKGSAEGPRDRRSLPYMAWSCISPEVAWGFFLCEVSQPQKFVAESREGNLFIFCSVPTPTCGVMWVAEQRVKVP